MEMVKFHLAAFWVCLILYGAACQPSTDPDELAALKVVGDSLKMGNFWNFSVDPCSGLNKWNDTAQANSFGIPTTGVECSCSNTTCRITRIVVVSMDVDGQIPPEIGNFSLLNDLNLGQNLISGTLPDEIGSLTNLQTLNFAINKLTGPFPASIGKLTKLYSLGFGSNSFSGTLPKEIGNLQSLRKLYMDSCNLVGELPREFGNLTKLEILWSAGNRYNGTFPEFFSDMIGLQDFKIHGNNFQGPLPASFAKLQNLKTLNLGDIPLGGRIPDGLTTLTGLSKLILRNCELSGSIPDFRDLTSLKHLDLSFNNLTGTIPSSLWSLPSLETLLLGSNQLTGQLPSELPSNKLQQLDLSYNDLTGALPSWLSKLQRNYIWNRFNIDSNPRAAASNCLQSRDNCSLLREGRNFGFAVNCGGPEVRTTTGTVFSDDSRAFTMGTHYSSNQDWAVSSTGQYDGAQIDSILNTTVPVSGSSDPSLYQTSRSAPSTVRYLGLRMINGAYTLQLHFSEIKLDNNSSWRANSRRIFDVYIQGSLKLKDFNVQNEAGGSLRALMRRFTSVNITNNVLDILFQWKGKGTCCYGPLIAAIQVIPEFDTTGLETQSGKNSKGVAIGVGVGVSLSVLLVVLLLAFLYTRQRQKRLKDLLEEDEVDFRNLEGKTDLLYSYNEMKNATRGFAPENKLGQGGFGAVYKGVLSNGTVVAIKQLSSKSQQGSREFLNEVTIISNVQHRNLVKLHGCCIEGAHRLLVYEYLENNSLHHVLLSSKSSKYHLEWPARFNICVGVARGIAYLHEDSKPKIVHRDIKASNVLLDANMNPKIADFGLAKLFEDHETHVSTRVAGTIGYLAPEYAMRGQLTDKADVYSFGVLALEVVSGRNNLDTSLPVDQVYLLEWAWNLYENGSVLDLVDKGLTSFSEEQAARVIKVALLCSQAVAASRPMMSHVVAMLVGTAPVDVSSLRPGYFTALKNAAPGFFSDGGVSAQRLHEQVSSSSFSNNFTSGSTIPSEQTSSSIPSEHTIVSGR